MSIKTLISIFLLSFTACLQSSDQKSHTHTPIEQKNLTACLIMNMEEREILKCRCSMLGLKTTEGMPIPPSSLILAQEAYKAKKAKPNAKQSSPLPSQKTDFATL